MVLLWLSKSHLSNEDGPSQKWAGTAEQSGRRAELKSTFKDEPEPDFSGRMQQGALTG